MEDNFENGEKPECQQTDIRMSPELEEDNEQELIKIQKAETKGLQARRSRKQFSPSRSQRTHPRQLCQDVAGSLKAVPQELQQKNALSRSCLIVRLRKETRTHEQETRES